MARKDLNNRGSRRQMPSLSGSLDIVWLLRGLQGYAAISRPLENLKENEKKGEEGKKR